MASEDLDPIVSVIKSFGKHPNIVEIKTKALDSTFHFRKTSCNEVEKIISNLNIKKSCQQEYIPIETIKLNKDLAAKFKIWQLKISIFALKKVSFLLNLKMPILPQFIERKIRATKVSTDQ